MIPYFHEDLKMKASSLLVTCRKDIDKIDKQILQLLSKRFSFTKKIQIIKRQYDLKIRQRERENQILRNIKKYCKKLVLPFSAVKKMYKHIFLAARHQ